MTGGIFADPVITYPGIFSRVKKEYTSMLEIPNGSFTTSTRLGIDGLGEDYASNFPTANDLPCNSWILAWAVTVEAMGSWLGDYWDWTKLKLQLYHEPGIPSGGYAFLGEYILPLTTGWPASASGERRIHADKAWIQIRNDTGQAQTISWNAWAKAA